MIKEIFVNSLISALCVVILVIIFEIIFFFFKIKKDIEANSLRLISKIPVLPFYNGSAETEQILANLVSENKTKLKNERIKRIGLVVILLVIFIIFTTILTILLYNMIDFTKLISFVILTFVAIVVIEIILYFEVFSKLKTTNDNSLLVELYNQIMTDL